MLRLLCVAFSLASFWGLAEPYFSDKPNSFTRSICGPTDDMLPMIDQPDWLKSMGHPVGIYRVGGMSCSGTLVSKDLFLTARHCSADCSAITVTFGHLSGRQEETFNCIKIVEKGNSSTKQDYMIVQLNNEPGLTWGWYEPSDRPMTVDETLLMIHHPSGLPMRVSQEDSCQFKSETAGMLNHRCDTRPGSSGSAILVPDYLRPELTRVVGVHTLGGCGKDATSTNSGPAMSYLVTISPTLRELSRTW